MFIPSADDPDTVLQQMTAFRLMRLEDHFERVITFRPPAHVVRHSRKVVWFIHHMRVVLRSLGHRVPADAGPCAAPRARAAVMRADTAALREARRVFTNSRVVGDRLRRFNGLESEVLYPPVLRPELFAAGEYGDEIVCVCRVERHKRQHLLMEAMRHVRTPVRLRLCGIGLDADYIQSLRRLAAESGDGDRVVVEDRWITEEEKAARLQARAGLRLRAVRRGLLRLSHHRGGARAALHRHNVRFRRRDGIRAATARPASSPSRQPEPSPPPSTGCTPTAPSRAASAPTPPAASRSSASTGTRWSRSAARMKVLVLSNMVPFVRGGAEELCDHLVRNLRLRRGVEAEAMRIPFTWEPAERLVEEMLVARSLSIVNVDRLIPLKFPAYLAPHPNKVPWLLHQFRQAYDLFDAGQSNIRRTRAATRCEP